MSIVNLYYILLHIIQPEIEKTKAEEFPVGMFYREYREYHEFQRLGGTLHHLHTHNPITNQSILLRKVSSKNTSTSTSTSTTTTTQTNAVITSMQETESENESIESKEGKKEDIEIKFELFDTALLFFSLMLSKKLAKATEQFTRQEQLKRQLEECYERLELVSKEKVSSF
jgi:hypothetical protein